MFASMKFKGTGNELCGRMIGGILLSLVTLGIYLPWFLVGLTQYVANSTTIQETQKGDLTLDFKGTGGEFFVNVLVGSLLTMMTIGLYLPWFIVSFIHLCVERTTATAADGTVYTGRFNTTGGDTFGKLIVGALLTMVTMGLYGPWFQCEVHKHFLTATTIHANGQTVGKFDFVGQGWPLFKEMWVGFWLLVVTLGIYGAWYAVRMTKFFTANTRLTIGETTYAGAFNGTGNTYFGITFLGGILTAITFGIYAAWAIASALQFHIDNTEVVAEGVSGKTAMVPA